MAKIETVEHLDDYEQHHHHRDVPATHVNQRFGIDGRDYEIDLSDENHERLMTLLSEFIQSARRTVYRLAPGRVHPSAARPFAGARPRVSSQQQQQAVREWARRQGIEVAQRGSIRREVVAAFHAAHAARPLHRPTASPGREVVAVPEALFTAPARATPAPDGSPENLDDAAPADTAPADTAFADLLGQAMRPELVSVHPAFTPPAPRRPRQWFTNTTAWNAAIREWSAARGHPLAPRGAIPTDVRTTWLHHFGDPVIGGAPPADAEVGGSGATG
jgi:hypothetical protein